MGGGTCINGPYVLGWVGEHVLMAVMFWSGWGNSSAIAYLTVYTECIQQCALFISFVYGAYMCVSMMCLLIIVLLDTYTTCCVAT